MIWDKEKFFFYSVNHISLIMRIIFLRFFKTVPRWAEKRKEQMMMREEERRREKEESRRELERKMEVVQDEIAKEKKLQQVGSIKPDYC